MQNGEQDGRDWAPSHRRCPSHQDYSQVSKASSLHLWRQLTPPDGPPRRLSGSINDPCPIPANTPLTCRPARRAGRQPAAHADHGNQLRGLRPTAGVDPSLREGQSRRGARDNPRRSLEVISHASAWRADQLTKTLPGIRMRRVLGADLLISQHAMRQTSGPCSGALARLLANPGTCWSHDLGHNLDNGLTTLQQWRRQTRSGLNYRQCAYWPDMASAVWVIKG